MNSDTKIKLSIVITLYIIIAAAIVVFGPIDIASLNANPNLRPIIAFLQAGFPYFLLSIVFSATASSIQVSLLGTFAKSTIQTLNLYSLAFLIYFLFNQYLPPQNKIASIYILSITMLLVTYPLLNTILKSFKQFTLGALSNFTILTLIAIFFQLTTFALTQNQEVANSIMIGFVFGGLTTIATPLQESAGPKKKKIGRFLGKGTGAFIILGIMIGLYIYFLRPKLVQMNSTYVLIGEWLVIGLAALIALLSLRSKIAPVTGPLLIESWQKHQQELGFRTTEDFLVLSQAIDNFINSGGKNDLLLFLFRFLHENKVNPTNMNIALDELINYQNQTKPRLFFSWDNNLLEQQTMEKRKTIAKNLINNLNADLFRNKWS
jgi:hypothetical protein